jgi:hypothetical protein
MTLLEKTEDGLHLGFNIIKRAVTEAQHHFDSRLVACYALGSLAHGGFSPIVSDIDLGLILQDPLLDNDQALINQIQSIVTSTKAPLAERLSLFWTSVSVLETGKLGGRFPLHDRLDLIEHGKLLRGSDIKSRITRPSKRDILIDSSQFALDHLYTETIVEQIKKPEKLVDKDIRYMTKIILFPVRLLYTARTGNIGYNQDSVLHYLKMNQGKKSELVECAYHWRQRPPSSTNGIVDLLIDNLRSLYLEFLEEYYSAMQLYDQQHLANALSHWKNALISS